MSYQINFHDPVLSVDELAFRVQQALDRRCIRCYEPLTVDPPGPKLCDDCFEKWLDEPLPPCRYCGQAQPDLGFCCLESRTAPMRQREAEHESALVRAAVELTDREVREIAAIDEDPEACLALLIRLRARVSDV